MDVGPPGSSLAGDVGRGNLVVLRSFGKFFGLAGIRLGFALLDQPSGGPACGDARTMGGVRAGLGRRRGGLGGHGMDRSDAASVGGGVRTARWHFDRRRSRHRGRHGVVPAGANAGGARAVPSSRPRRNFGAQFSGQRRRGCASACRRARKSGNDCKLRWMPSATTARLSLMSANSIPQVEGAAQRSTGFDAAFRARLRDLLVWRRDVRRFRRDPLPSGTLESLIELACLAPSVGLSQPWRFVIVEDATARAAIRHNFATCNAAGARRAKRRPRRSLRAAQARRLGRGALSLGGVRRSRDDARPRPRPSHHAGNDRLFGGDGGAHDLARRARARHRHGLGIDPRCHRRLRRCSTCPPNGNSSAISVSAIRKPTTRSPSSSRADGSGGACRRP